MAKKILAKDAKEKPVEKKIASKKPALKTVKEKSNVTHDINAAIL
jgi:hypothetical protein